MSSNNSNRKMGPDAYNWKGKDVSYHGLHNWVRNRLGKPFMCEQCGKDDKKTRYEWSNIDGEYERDLNDYVMLCVSCHRKRDNVLRIRQSKELATSLASAQLQATRSYAKRLKVGAVLLQDGHIISNGRNGTPPGFDNDCEDENGDTKPEVMHAESNAVAFAAKRGISTEGAIMVCTHSPCFECSKLLLSAGIKKIYYEEEYRLTDSIEFLREGKVIVERIEDGREEKSRPPTETRGPKTITPIQTYRGPYENPRGSASQLNQER